MENNSVREIFFGLEEYLKFKGNTADVSVIREFVKILDSDNMESAILEYCLKNLHEHDPKDKIFRGIKDYKKKINNNDILDAFSRSQIKSKIWLIEELTKIRSHYENVMIMAGWFGQLKPMLDERLNSSRTRIIEIDKNACQASDYIFNLSNLENYKVKSVCTDINNLVLHKNGYEWEVSNFREDTGYNEKFLPDLVINTSAEHMTEEWYNQIRFKQLESNPVVAIQSNNLFDISEHINCVHSVDHMKKKFPMREILFEGELQLKGYKRVMLIGRP